jgi:hypothetical protein
MTNFQHQLLLAGFNDTEAVRIVSTLRSFDVDFHRAPWGDGLVGFVGVREFDAIVLRYPKVSRDLALFLEGLRAETGYSRHAGVVVLAEKNRIEAARSYVNHGINRVVSLEKMGEELRESVLELLDVARRFPLRAPIKLDGRVKHTQLTAHCHTENLSMSGMLVCSSKLFPVGSPVDFAISVPGEDQPIRGRARVARLTDPGREKVLGMGASFEEFSENHRSRLRSLLLSQVL